VKPVRRARLRPLPMVRPTRLPQQTPSKANV
jgi:hypothetical protein